MKIVVLNKKETLLLSGVVDSIKKKNEKIKAKEKPSPSELKALNFTEPLVNSLSKKL